VESIRQYLLSIVSVVIICGIMLALVNKNSSLRGVLKLLTGLLLAVVLVKPWAQNTSWNFNVYFEEAKEISEQAAAFGEGEARSEMASIIKSRSEAYILDKAAAIGVQLSVNISLTDSEIPEPYQVTVSGNVSPYVKQTLKRFIANNLGISEENQTWI